MHICIQFPHMSLFQLLLIVTKFRDRDGFSVHTFPHNSLNPNRLPSVCFSWDQVLFLMHDTLLFSIIQQSFKRCHIYRYSLLTDFPKNQWSMIHFKPNLSDSYCQEKLSKIVILTFHNRTENINLHGLSRRVKSPHTNNKQNKHKARVWL